MTPVDEEAKKGGFKFPGAVTTLAIVTLLVWVAARARRADSSSVDGSEDFRFRANP